MTTPKAFPITILIIEDSAVHANLIKGVLETQVAESIGAGSAAN
jgi:hypothetical protein